MPRFVEVPFTLCIEVPQRAKLPTLMAAANEATNLSIYLHNALVDHLRDEPIDFTVRLETGEPGERTRSDALGDLVSPPPPEPASQAPAPRAAETDGRTAADEYIEKVTREAAPAAVEMPDPPAFMRRARQ